MDEQQFIELFNQTTKQNKPVDLVYKLYYNKETGNTIQYTTDELEGDYIEITKQQYAESRYDSLVIDGVLTSVTEVESWTKIVLDNEGVACRDNNAMIVDSNSNTRWKVKTYYCE
jgi:hypothetical protein